jgi:predicted alpha/beta superfamily hydrolase
VGSAGGFSVSGPTGVCLFLDGEYYLDWIRAPEIIAELQREGQLPPMLMAYVSHIDSATRWKDSFCSAEFAEYLAMELLPWLVAECGVSSEKDNIIAGLSLTGLSAAHAALTYPKSLPRVLSQSGSFWWNEGWLARDVGSKPCSDVLFRLTVGRDERNENVEWTTATDCFRRNRNSRRTDACATPCWRREPRRHELEVQVLWSGSLSSPRQFSVAGQVFALASKRKDHD